MDGQLSLIAAGDCTPAEDTLTPADYGLRLTVTQPDPAWLSRRVCTPDMPHTDLTAVAGGWAATHSGTYPPGVDRHIGGDVDRYGEWDVPQGVEPRPWRQDVAEAKTVCMGCPVRLQCLGSAIYAAEVPGIAGGWTEAQRDAYRARWGIPRPADHLDDTDPALVERVGDLTAAGVVHARDVADLLAVPDVTEVTVEYARQILAGTKRPDWWTQRGAA